jgi:hypothetical protein
MSPEMQRYVTHMLGKQRAASTNIPGSFRRPKTPIHPESSVRKTQVPVPKDPISSPPQIQSPLSVHGETQSLSHDKVVPSASESQDKSQITQGPVDPPTDRGTPFPFPFFVVHTLEAWLINFH